MINTLGRTWFCVFLINWKNCGVASGALCYLTCKVLDRGRNSLTQMELAYLNKSRNDENTYDLKVGEVYSFVESL